MAPVATWRPEAPEPGGLYLQNKKIHLFNNKSRLLFVITFPVTIKINPDITVYFLDIQTDVEM